MMRDSVFFVFGRNVNLKNQVKLTLMQWGIKCITIDEHGGIGSTIIENLEDLVPKAEFAVVLYSGDDEGRLYEPEKKEEDKKKLEVRARENVVAELGYVIAKYGRNNVCILYEDGVTIPSDFSGVKYIRLNDDWKLLLARYLQKSNFTITL